MVVAITFQLGQRLRDVLQLQANGISEVVDNVSGSYVAITFRKGKNDPSQRPIHFTCETGDRPGDCSAQQGDC